MSNFNGYTTRSFSETQKFFVLDPQTGTPSFVLGSDLVDQLTPNSNYVFAESTRATAQATDYAVGQLIQTAGSVTAGDGLASGYLVVPSGDGDFPMDNGNDLLVISGDDALREQLISNASGEGSDLVAHTGTANTVTETLDQNIADINQRVIYVGSVAELEALSLASGVSVYLTEPGRAGEFLVKSGTPPADPQKGIYIVLANGNYAVRQFGQAVITDGGRVNVQWFGAIGDEVNDDTDAVEGALLLGSTIYIPTGRYLITRQLDASKKLTIVGDSHAIGENSTTSSVLVKDATVLGDLLTLRANTSSVENLVVEGQSGNTGDGIVLLGARQEIRNVAVFGMGQDGIRIGRDTTGPNCNLFKMSNIKAKRNGRHGINIDQESSSGLWEANAGSLIDADLQDNTEAGIHLGYCGFNTFINLGCQDNGTYGLFASDNSQNHKFYGGDFEVNGRPDGSSSTDFYDFYLSDLSEGNFVIGITCFNFPRTLYIGSPQNTVLGVSSGNFAGDQQYNGLMMRNIPSDVPTMLDHYEEGTFTPVAAGTSTAGTASYSVQQGKFTRVGNLVTFNVALIYTGHTGTGDLVVSGLPFQSSGLWALSIVTGGIQVSQYRVVVSYINSASTDAQIRQTRTYNGSSLGDTTLETIPMDAAGTIYISGAYQASS